MGDTTTNLDRLRAATEHVRLHPGLEDSLSSVGVMFNSAVLLWARETPARVTALVEWARSIGTTTVQVHGHKDNFHMEAVGRLAGGLHVSVTVVITDTARLIEGGVTAGRTVTVDQLASLFEAVAK